MLVLTRETGQSIIITVAGIDQKIKFKLLTNDGRHIRVGVEAPENMPIDREEIYNWKQKNKAKKANKNRTGDNSLKDEAPVSCVS